MGSPPTGTSTMALISLGGSRPMETASILTWALSPGLAGDSHFGVGRVALAGRRVELAQRQPHLLRRRKARAHVVGHAARQRFEQMVRLPRADRDDELRDLAVVDGVGQTIAQLGGVRVDVQLYVDLELAR